MRVVVIGAGIVGASVAWRLTLKGAEVRPCRFFGAVSPASQSWIQD